MTMKKNKIKEIVFLTLRDNKGATGGPGGVLFLQKQMLGEKLLGIPCKYQFNILAGNLGKLKNILNKILFFFKYCCKKILTRRNILCQYSIMDRYTA